MIDEISQLSQNLGFSLTTTQVRYLQEIVSIPNGKITKLLPTNDIDNYRRTGKTHVLLVYLIYNIVNFLPPYILYVAYNEPIAEIVKYEFLQLLWKYIKKEKNISIKSETINTVEILVNDSPCIIKFSGFGNYLNHTRGNVCSKVIFDSVEHKY